MSPSLARIARTGVVVGAALLVASSATAQTFNIQNGVLPAKVWTEGVECIDIENDGDLDFAFANGEGFSGAGAKRQNTLIMNRLEIAPADYRDVSTARLGVNTSNAKNVISGDVHNDGWDDLLFANAFNNEVPFLYANQGAGNPGFFTLSSAAAGFTENLNSASAAFGDIDNDGDLDVIINDSGSNYLGGAGDEPRLFFNDGSGVFTEDAVAMNAVAKDSQMDVQFADLDGDWDLDFFGVCRGSNPGGNHYLMLNDGAGNFTDVSSLIPATSTSVYEAEIGDLDGDTDPDMFFVSSSGFSEGHIRNNFAGSGVLTFTKGSTFSGGDDNEVVLIDHDNDGDLDAMIGSLTNREKLFRNDGGLTWATASGAIQAFNDSTLDATAADLDNDGDYDLITAQGESNSNNWNNKVYENSGTTDTLPPVIVRTETLGGLPDEDGPWVVRGEIRDQMLDDGKNWVRGEADYVVLSTPSEASVSMAGLSFTPANIVVAAGTTVTWDNPTFAVHTVTSTDAPYTFNSGDMNNGDTFSYTFVRPGTYNYHCIPHQGAGMIGTVTVTGSSTTVDATYSNGNLYRFAMTDTAGGAGVQLAYELRYTDWAGNESVTSSALETIIPCGFFQYDVGASPSNTVDLDGTGSTSIDNPFSIVASNVTGFATVFGVSLAKANYPLLGGVGLIDPFQLVLTRVRGVTAGVSNWNLALPDDPSVAGVRLFFQASSLISVGPDVWEHSNGLEMDICP